VDDEVLSSPFSTPASSVDQHREPGRVAVLELAHMVMDVTGSSSELFEPLPTGDPTRRQPTSPARELLHWECATASFAPTSGTKDERATSRRTQVRRSVLISAVAAA
jgi:hypothetical protein